MFIFYPLDPFWEIFVNKEMLANKTSDSTIQDTKHVLLSAIATNCAKQTVQVIFVNRIIINISFEIVFHQLSH